MDLFSETVKRELSTLSQDEEKGMKRGKKCYKRDLNQATLNSNSSYYA